MAVTKYCWKLAFTTEYDWWPKYLVDFTVLVLWPVPLTWQSDCHSHGNYWNVDDNMYGMHSICPFLLVDMSRVVWRVFSFIYKLQSFDIMSLKWFQACPFDKFGLTPNQYLKHHISKQNASIDLHENGVSSTPNALTCSTPAWSPRIPSLWILLLPCKRVGAVTVTYAW